MIQLKTNITLGVTRGGRSGAIVVNEGGTLSVGNSVGELVIDGVGTGLSAGSLTLNGGSALVFEFRNALGTTAGTHWDYIDLTGGGLLNINANNQSPDNQIKVFIDSWKSDNSGHGGGTIPLGEWNNFNAGAPTGPGNIQQYFWKFIGLDNVNTSGAGHSINLLDTFPGSISGRFQVIDNTENAGVFYDDPLEPNGNPYLRPISSLGRGTFKILAGDFGQGYGLYVTYSAVPEPSSLVLATISSLGMTWYGRRRRKNLNVVAKAAVCDEPLSLN